MATVSAKHRIYRCRQSSHFLSPSDNTLIARVLRKRFYVHHSAETVEAAGQFWPSRVRDLISQESIGTEVRELDESANRAALHPEAIGRSRPEVWPVCSICAKRFSALPRSRPKAAAVDGAIAVKWTRSFAGALQPVAPALPIRATGSVTAEKFELDRRTRLVFVNREEIGEHGLILTPGGQICHQICHAQAGQQYYIENT